MTPAQYASGLRSCAAKLVDAANLVDAALGVIAVPALPAVTAAPRKVRTTGTNALVLAAIKDGHDKIDAIARDVKVSPFIARNAVKALEQVGKVRKEGAGRTTRYVVA